MAEAESVEAITLRDKASEMLKSIRSRVRSIALASKVKNTSKFHTKSSSRLHGVIRKEIVETLDGGKFVYSSSACLPTFSIGLSSDWRVRPPLSESSVDPKDKFPHHLIQMPELGARVFVGDGDGIDTITCYVFHDLDEASEFHLDSEYAAVRSLYEDDRPGGLSVWLEAQPLEEKPYSRVILSGTELAVGQCFLECSLATVGNLGGKSSRVSDSISDYKGCTGDEISRQPSEIEQPADLVPGVHCYGGDHDWITVEGPAFFRCSEGSYLEKPKFMKMDNRVLTVDKNLVFPHVVQLTRFDDFVILGSKYFYYSLRPQEVIDIVRKNASETPDVIAAQLVKGASKNWRLLPRYPMTAIVIFLDHKEILLREHKKKNKGNMAKKDRAILLGLKGISHSIAFGGDKEIAKLKEEEKITFQKEENISTSKREDKIGIMMKEALELELKSTTISSNLPSAEMQDDSQASSFVVSIEDNDCKDEDFMVPHDITKWIIYRDLQERTLLCFFNVEEKQFEFYFEDHESMATIIGLGVPHSKVVLECESSHVTVVEIPKEDWDVVWAHSKVIPPEIPKEDRDVVYTHSKVIPLSIPEGNVLKYENFPHILHHIANVISMDNSVSKASNGGAREHSGKGKAQDNANDRKGKGKAHNHGNDGNTGHPDGSSHGAPDDYGKKEKKGKDNDNGRKEKKGKDRNDGKKDGRDRDDGKFSNDGKEVQATVYLLLLPGGVLKDKGKKIEPIEGHEEEGEEKKKDVEGHEEGEEKKKELEEGQKGVEKKKKKYLMTIRNAFKQSKKGNVGNQQKSTTAEEGENGDVDEELQKQLDNQIHVEMMFTFTIKGEAGGLLKTIRATIRYIEFQLPSNNKRNYLQTRRFGWFHEKLQVAYGAVDTQVAILDPKSRQVLDSFEVEEICSRGNSKGKAGTVTDAYKGRMGGSFVASGFAEYNRTNGSETTTTEEVHNSWKTNIKVTEGDFCISDCTNLKSQQLKYSYYPRSPFKEEEFQELHDQDRLKMYDLDPICQSQQVSCEGTWHPYNSKKLEAYKLEASRELQMTRIYDSKLKKNQKEVQKRKKNLPLCFIQKLEKVMYLNHAMSHLNSSTSGVYRLRELENLSNPSTFLTQGQYNKEPKWPGNDSLVDVKQ